MSEIHGVGRRKSQFRRFWDLRLRDDSRPQAIRRSPKTSTLDLSELLTFTPQKALIFGGALLILTTAVMKITWQTAPKSALNQRQSIVLPQEQQRSSVEPREPLLGSHSSPQQSALPEKSAIASSETIDTNAETVLVTSNSVVESMINSDAEIASSNLSLPEQLATDASPTDVQPSGPLVTDYQVVKGDTLSGLFDQFGIEQAQVFHLLEADYSVLALDTLRPGDKLRFYQQRQTRELEKLEVIFNPAHQVVFSRTQDGLDVEDIREDGEWRSSAIDLAIKGSFYGSAKKAGLTPKEIQRIATLFKDNLDFRRLRAGDTVRILRESQFYEDQATGEQRLLAVVFEGRKWRKDAFLHDDGNYYDSEGDSLGRAFLRVPMKKQYRISSRFNPRRLHPVTRRISPHNGTDFAAPTGAAVLAAGDGVVTRVENHRIAGKYIVIEHGGQYRSRYLHLSRIDVRRGQKVTRGQQIGAVGSTGRVTGPHLHYEFHIKKRAVNPMTAKIPMATKVKSEDKQAYLAQVYQYEMKMARMFAQADGIVLGQGTPRNAAP